MLPTRLYWPAGRSLFRKRTRSWLGISVAVFVGGLALALASTWPG